MSRAVAAVPYVLAVLLAAGGMAYANLPDLTEVEDYAHFPPFEPHKNRLFTRHLGAEYLCIAEAIRAGRGFADPFQTDSGPTAWMPPLLPAIQAGFLWAFADDRTWLKWAFLTCQAVSLAVAGWLVVAAAARAFPTPRRWLALVFFALALCDQFRLAFQTTHDHWLTMLMLSLLLLGFARLPAGPAWGRAAGWGLLGGLAALAGPVLGVVWAALTVCRWPGVRNARWWAVGVAAAGLVMLPWVARNYLVFGRVIPVKSNLFYELYQSQCETPDGLVRNWAGFNTHPYSSNGPARWRYVEVGEMRFLDEKRAVFLAAVRADPGDFAVRVWNRLVGATLVVVPMDKAEEFGKDVWLSDFGAVCHAAPLLAVAVLVLTPRRWHRYEVAAAAVYAAWLTPYVIVSYYDRYGFPLLGVKAFLVAAAADRLVRGAWSLLRGR